MAEDDSPYSASSRKAVSPATRANSAGQIAGRPVRRPPGARHSFRQTSASGLLLEYSREQNAFAAGHDPTAVHPDARTGSVQRLPRRHRRDRQVKDGLSTVAPPRRQRPSNRSPRKARTRRAVIDEKPSRETHTRAAPLHATRRQRMSTCRIACIAAAVIVFLIVIIVPAAVVTHDKRKASDPPNSNLGSISPSSIPPDAQGTYLDPFSWYDTTDFNVTFTNATVGGLSVMGLNSTWSDETRANPSVPALSQAWSYGTTKVHGINLGGWLSLEPFITPSMFSADRHVIDEFTLCTSLGANASHTIEKHYATFITETDFHQIQQAGFDHVRISYSYWAVITYSGDPYVEHTSWRYLLRGIEWARKYGLRVNLDLHAAPGSQNGWNHSGRQGQINWLNGPDGQLNAERTLDIHRQLTAFFAQPRYANIVTMYGILNEPNMLTLAIDPVINWTTHAIDIVRASAMPSTAIIIIGDGFLGIPTWHDLLPADKKTNVLLDVHEYVVFNADQIALNHTSKLDFACQGWSQQAAQSMDTAQGFGNFICGEWSQSDTDCAMYVNNVGAGSRWQGTLDTGNATTSVLSPRCATFGEPACQCAPANASPSVYSSEYRDWLKKFAEAQLQSFEVGWGSFYWTWKTESATQWSWKLALAAGTVPQNVRTRDFTCGVDAIPDFEALGLSETY